MSELTFEQMLEESCKTIHNGEVVEGTVIAVKPDEIILNIGYKSDGIITRTVYPEVPPRVEYALSPLGETMRPILDAMQAWGNAFKAGELPEA